jgi:hypothetical protein
MKVEDLANRVIGACESESLDYMVTGAFAFGFYGIPRFFRSTQSHHLAPHS